ncbi:5-methyltetrahydropteroyltriglutamate--homocysteine S-methyltransferase [Shewanella maritima]|uniref:5-methyltetrahydropteroyltriglutamate--homocysteine methyltransferase n=1 Tax=Shewanella maritima TaxID=2520507 RepID=A0A411PEQ3_9GAMM|nr:5-methyltetrahydropteroyltriglutamate--homocysteine S-methyltransferase [Shewanella maritima]QBF82066.1 5-methyltetrahydropteroyltriglutamate--homocysteine S-methyltransferase [Shewanella maritima]
MKITNLGFPRIGRDRELKFALEQYWRGEIDQAQLEAQALTLKQTHWQWQADAGIEFIPVGDFAYYDHVLTLSAMLNVIPARHRQLNADGTAAKITLDTLFNIARGAEVNGEQASASAMKKFFNTNYHYQVPELEQDQVFELAFEQIFEEVEQAKACGHQPKPVLLGPVSFLALSQAKGEFDKLQLLTKLLPVYEIILQRFAEQGVTWVQFDEPILASELSQSWQQAISQTYQYFADSKPSSIKVLLASYYGDIQHHAQLVNQLPVEGLHIDLIAGNQTAAAFLPTLEQQKVLSLGVINGRNVWAADIDDIAEQVQSLINDYDEQIWLAPSCSLLHSPVDLDAETELNDELKLQLAFAKQKLNELTELGHLVTHPQSERSQHIRSLCAKRKQARSARRNEAVYQRLDNLTEQDFERGSAYKQRQVAQANALKLPSLPITTIGSFPQTAAIRGLRRRWRQGELAELDYQQHIKAVIKDTIERQSSIGIDVLVHGESERNDMVEYFGEQLEGFAFTQKGWVQSYGSRCVKPPLIYGDVSRAKPMTLDWTTYAQSLTDKPVKGMLTGPVTILHWSFAREDIEREVIANQIGLAIRDEVVDLEQAGIGIIQIDEPAFREGLPIKQSEWQGYLDWAVKAFRLSACGVEDKTQIHTHMCYSEFNHTIEAIAAMDADVITIETSRSQMALLDAFEDFAYPNEIGPGVYDIHSPNIPKQQDITHLLQKAADKIPVSRLWVNPDCGLKTRTWDEVEPALVNIVAATRELRRQLC